MSIETEEPPLPQPGSPWDLAGTDMESVLIEVSRRRGHSLWRDAQARLRRNRAAWWSLLFLVGFSALSFATPLLPLPSPSALDLRDLPQPPVWPWETLGGPGFEPVYWELSWLDSTMVELRQQVFGDFQTGNWLGTDSKGRDVLSRILWGSRTSILVALAAAACSLVIGVGYGALSGLAGGRTDHLMMRAVDVLYSVPFLFVVILIFSILNAPRSDLAGEPLVDREKIFFMVIGAVTWLTMARVVRGQVLALKGSPFVEAAVVLGASQRRVLWVHLLPNLVSVVVVYLTLTIPAVILFEAFLSFLGLGIQVPKVSWGLLAVDGLEGLNPIKSAWWLILWPSLAMGSTLLALNLLGDGLRDALDPRSVEAGRT